MMKKGTFVLSSLLLVLLLAACGSSGAGVESGSVDASNLNEAYQDALPVAAQLALGSLQLEETDLAIDEAQAAGLLPLWQAYQTLSTSDKAAAVEVAAVLDQIQQAMTADQVEAIAAMALTAEDATSFMEEAGQGMGRGEMEQGDGATDGGGGPPAAGFGGEFLGGGPPDGGVPVGGGQLSEDELATRTAEFGDETEGMVTAMMDRVLANSLILRLQEKTGGGDA